MNLQEAIQWPVRILTCVYIGEFGYYVLTSSEEASFFFCRILRKIHLTALDMFTQAAACGNSGAMYFVLYTSTHFIEMVDPSSEFQATTIDRLTGSIYRLKFPPPIMQFRINDFMSFISQPRNGSFRPKLYLLTELWFPALEKISTTHSADCE